jgi:hypothetical protein
MILGVSMILLCASSDFKTQIGKSPKTNRDFIDITQILLNDIQWLLMQTI